MQGCAWPLHMDSEQRARWHRGQCCVERARIGCEAAEPARQNATCINFVTQRPRLFHSAALCGCPYSLSLVSTLYQCSEKPETLAAHHFNARVIRRRRCASYFASAQSACFVMASGLHRCPVCRLAECTFGRLNSPCSAVFLSDGLYSRSEPTIFGFLFHPTLTEDAKVLKMTTSFRNPHA
jgi:hypothetical protein